MAINGLEMDDENKELEIEKTIIFINQVLGILVSCI